MSSKGGGGATINNNGKGNTGISGIPAGSRKMVQSLKEIVNCPEPEIYAMLKECNMDPNEAVNRLLSQDPFHEVKSKREKKKENKETTDPRSRGANSTTHRGGRGGADRYNRSVLTQFSSNDFGASHGKTTYKKENGTHAYAGGSSSASSVSGNTVNRRPALQSDSGAAENKMSSVGAGDGVSSLQPTSGFQSPWSGVPGQVSMADIVKMGRPQNKTSAMPPHRSVSHQYPAAPPLAASNHDLHLLENHAAKMSDRNAEQEASAGLHVHSNDEWPSIEQPSATSVPSVLEAPVDSELYGDSSNLPLDRVNQNKLDDVHPAEEVHVDMHNGTHVGPAPVSSRNIEEDGAVGSSIFDNNLYGSASSFQHPRHAFEHEAEDGVSSVATNLQQLSVQSDDQGTAPEEENPSVIIPNHLQVHAQDCSHLSFGSFGSGINSAFSGTYASRTLKNNLEETSETVDVSSVAQSDARNPDYYAEEHLRNTADESLIHRAGPSPVNYESPVPQQEVLKEESPEIQTNQYAFPSSAPGYNYENSQQLNAAFNNPQTSSQMQNMTPFSSVMQAYTNSLPSNLLASTVLPGREPDLPYSPFPVSQSMPTKYNNTASITGASISMSEAPRGSSISAPQPTQQTLPGANVATGPTLPQHLAVHPYSQPTLPLGPFANMIGYPFLPQSYTYMPSAFQQTFAAAGNNTYHQSLAAAVLPQYKNSVSVSSLPQSAAVASAYGFGSSTSIPTGNFPLNPPTAPGGTTIGYDDVLSSQYKDGNHLISLQQNDNSGMWVHGPGSRTMSAVPASTYYSFQGQNQQQQPGGFRQGQQQLSQQQHFGALGYPNYYHSQTGMSLEHQQQNSRDAALGGSQGQPSKQTQQLWQNSY